MDELLEERIPEGAKRALEFVTTLKDGTFADTDELVKRARVSDRSIASYKKWLAPHRIKLSDGGVLYATTKTVAAYHRKNSVQAAS